MTHATYRWVSATLTLFAGAVLIGIFFYPGTLTIVLAGLSLWVLILIAVVGVCGGAALGDRQLAYARSKRGPDPAGPVGRPREPHRDFYESPNGSWVEDRL